MAIIVVGGSGQGVGKSVLVCGLIAALPEFHWTAVKITSHQHDDVELIREETEAGEKTDTARYLAAGARRALLVFSPEGQIPLGRIWEAIGPEVNVIFESNGIMAHLQPDLCLGVLGGPETEIKPSFEHFKQLADALVVRQGATIPPSSRAPAKPFFHLADLGHISLEMLDWVHRKLHLNLHS